MEEQNTTVNGDMDRRDLGLYIHIPFCAKKCAYCDFLSAPATKETMERYFAAILTEIEQYRGYTDAYTIPTIFIGGGTPSVVDAGYIEQIMDTLGRVFHIDRQRLEATIEINPGTITEDKLRIYRKIGINRLSFGLQSTSNVELSVLGRIHTYEQFVENFYLARKLGFQNINVDLMSAIPGQTLASWENTLNQVISLDPEHISAYSLIIEEETEFYDRYREGASGFHELPDEDTDRLMYHNTKELLKNSGYYRYEISNYAKIGYECRHNSSYWTGKEYLGIGLGASSLLNGARFLNVQELDQYINLCDSYKKNNNKISYIDKDLRMHNEIMEDLIGIRVNPEWQTQQQKMEEFMFLGLRMCAGISKSTFAQRFGIEINTVYQDIIDKMVRDKLLEISGDQIRLTEYGIDISNYVLADFLIE